MAIPQSRIARSTQLGFCARTALLTPYTPERPQVWSESLYVYSACPFWGTSLPHNASSRQRCLQHQTVGCGITGSVIISDHLLQVHGVSGLDGVTGLPDPADPEMTNLIKSDRHNTAIKALERTSEDLVGREEKFTLIATGPLSNVALFLLSFPELAAQSIEEIVLMGGSVEEVGNSNDSRSAEW